jgi:hypothetical protein
MEDTIAQLQPSEAPFTVLLMKMAKGNTSNAKYEWMEDDMAPRWDAINAVGGYADNITALVVDNASYFTIGDVVQIPRTNEVFIVTAITLGTNTLTVRRGYGETAAVAIVDNDALQIIGNANAEGSGSRAINLTNPVPNFNYTQIFKTSFGVTETLKSTNLYGGNELDYQRKKKGVEHRIDIERAFMFGERKLDTSNYSHPLRMTRGLLKFVSSNVKNVNGAALTEGEFDTFAEMAFAHGSDKKIMFSGDDLLTKLATWGKAKLQLQQGESTYGLSIYDYKTPHGTFKIVKHKLFTGSVYGKFATVVDLQNVSMKTLKNRGTKLLTNIQANDEDQEKDQYLTEAGLQVKQEKTHAILKNWA